MKEAGRIKGGCERCCHEPSIQAKACLAKKNLQVSIPQNGCRDVETSVVPLHGRAGQFSKLKDVADPSGAKGDQPIQRRGSWTQRGWTKHEPSLELGLSITEKRQHQPRTAAKPPKYGAFPHSGPAGKHVHGDGVSTDFGDEVPGRAQQAFTISGRVAPFVEDIRLMEGSGARRTGITTTAAA